MVQIANQNQIDECSSQQANCIDDYTSSLLSHPIISFLKILGSPAVQFVIVFCRLIFSLVLILSFRKKSFISYKNLSFNLKFNVLICLLKLLFAESECQSSELIYTSLTEICTLLLTVLSIAAFLYYNKSEITRKDFANPTLLFIFMISLVYIFFVVANIFGLMVSWNLNHLNFIGLLMYSIIAAKFYYLFK